MDERIVPIRHCGHFNDAGMVEIILPRYEEYWTTYVQAADRSSALHLKAETGLPDRSAGPNLPALMMADYPFGDT